MHALRPALAAVLLAVLAVGGVVLPAAHRAVHGLELAAERAGHVAAFHGDADAPQAQAPCPPQPGDVDCAVCAGLSAAADPASADAPAPDEPDGATAARADWVRTTTAAGAGARAPPAG